MIFDRFFTLKSLHLPIQKLYCKFTNIHGRAAFNQLVENSTKNCEIQPIGWIFNQKLIQNKNDVIIKEGKKWSVRPLKVNKFYNIF